MSLNLKSSGGGSVTVDVPSTASNYTATLPAANGTVQVSGNQPAFSVYGTSVSVSNATQTKLTVTTERFDTNNNFASNAFTPSVAGYYQINAAVSSSSSGTGYVQVNLYVNGSLYYNGTTVANNSTGPNIGVASLLYLNGSTDYVEIYVYQTSGASLNITLRDFSGALVRAA